MRSTINSNSKKSKGSFNCPCSLLLLNINIMNVVDNNAFPDSRYGISVGIVGVGMYGVGIGMYGVGNGGRVVVAVGSGVGVAAGL